MANDYETLSGLLHDAELLDLSWHLARSELTLEFQCLRRGHGETGPVTLVLSQVRAIAAYSPLPRPLDGRRPAALDRAALISLDDLRNWPSRGAVWFKLNSRKMNFELQSTDCCEWLVGSAEDLHRDFEIHLATVRGHLFIACGAIDGNCNGEDLPIAEWTQQCDQWWAAWQRHWEEARSPADDPRFETAIPLDSDARTEPGRALDRPAFVVDTDAPPELLAPVQNYHQGHVTADWQRMALAYPDLDKTIEQRAAELRCRLEGGPWVYVRQVDAWWQEKQMACVVVRGVEHQSATQGEPVDNRETVITWELRRFADNWIIWNYSQGWVRYGSAPSLQTRQPWHDEWELDCHAARDDGELITRRRQQKEADLAFAWLTIGILVGLSIVGYFAAFWM